MTSDTESLHRLQTIVRHLRDPERGCPWDRKQSPESLRKYLLEEAEELAEAIDQGRKEPILEEIGDLFFILTLLAEIHAEQNLFTLNDCLDSICTKMIRRHPHVFADAPTGDDEQLRRQWNAIKRAEGKKT